MDPIIGEIRPFPYNYAPENWAMCNGQTLSISQYPALFAVIGIIYGGDAANNFKLPNLNNAAQKVDPSVIVGMGVSASGKSYTIGKTGGEQSVMLSSSQIPPHTHPFNGVIGTTSASTVPTSSSSLTNIQISTTPSATGVFGFQHVAGNEDNEATLHLSTIGPNNAQEVAHSNMAPYLPINYCIALAGDFPQYQ